MKKKLCLVILLIPILEGCSVLNLLQPDQDYGRDKNHQEFIRDTARNFEYWKIGTDRAIQNEVQGKPAGGRLSYNEQWRGVIRTLNDRTPPYYENKSRYIDYIIRQRRAHGLPELK